MNPTFRTIFKFTMPGGDVYRLTSLSDNVVALRRISPPGAGITDSRAAVFPGGQLDRHYVFETIRRCQASGCFDLKPEAIHA